MSYGYGLGVYWSDYDDPEEPDFEPEICDIHNMPYGECECQPVEIITIKCEKCGKEMTAIDEGLSTDAICGDHYAKPDPDWTPEF